MSQLLASAQLLARRWSFPVFPITAGGKTPAIPAAHPDGDPLRGKCRGECGLWGHGFHDATTNLETVEAMWAQWPESNIGIACGPARLVVVDLDPAKATRPERVLREQRPGELTPDGVAAPWDVLSWLTVRHGGHPPDLWRTLTVRTPSGGLHLYYLRPADLLVSSGAGMTSGLGWCIDVRAIGGYVVAPPSTRPDGDYRLTGRRPVQPMPVWLLDALTLAGKLPDPRTLTTTAPPSPVRPHGTQLDRRVHRYLRAAVTAELQNVMDAAAGTRNVTLNRAAFALGQLVAGAELDQVAAAAALLAAATAAGLLEREAIATIRSGMEAGTRTPRSRTS